MHKDKEHVMVDWHNFNIASVKAGGFKLFAEQHATPAYGYDASTWPQWLAGAYEAVTGEKPKPEKGEKQ